jgi:hypothetical protein
MSSVGQDRPPTLMPGPTAAGWQHGNMATGHPLSLPASGPDYVIHVGARRPASGSCAPGLTDPFWEDEGAACVRGRVAADDPGTPRSVAGVEG